MSSSSLDKYETVRYVLRMSRERRRQVGDHEVACSVERLLDLRSGRGYSSLDQRVSNVLGVHREDILLILTPGSLFKWFLSELDLDRDFSDLD